MSTTNTQPEPSDMWKLAGRACPSCKSRTHVFYRVVEDDAGHEDEQYRCVGCGHRWWVEGVDA